MKKFICFMCITAALSSNLISYADFMSNWAEDEFKKASQSTLLCHSVASGDMTGAITRREFCELAVSLYYNISGINDSENISSPFIDCDSKEVAQAYALGIISGVSENTFEPDRSLTREEMARILVKTIMNAGIELNLSADDKKYISKFSDSDKINDWSENALIFLIKNNIMSGIAENILSPDSTASREQALTVVNRVYSAFCDNKKNLAIPEILSADNDFNITWTEVPDCSMYKVIVKENNILVSDSIAFENKISIKNSGTKGSKGISVVVEAVLADGSSVFSMPYEVQSEEISNTLTTLFDKSLESPALLKNNTDKNVLVKSPYETPAPTPEPTITPDSVITPEPAITPEPKPTYIPPAVNHSGLSKEEKKKIAFAGGEPFATKEEAEANMTEIEVDVWSISSDGGKTAKKMSLTINKNIEENVRNIFKEIFESEEQFPIKSCGGFQWRTAASGNLSQHSYGTCIDINPNENYYISSSGSILSGSYWKPYEDPYSIPADSEIVKIFAKYGFLWGATAWGENSSKDYMHFTYLGN